MTHRLNFPRKTLLALLLGAAASWCAAAEPLTVIRATELRQDRFLDAPVVAPLALGQRVEMLRSEAGWVQVRVGQQTGWVRALSLRGSSGAQVAAVASVETGRSGQGNTMSTTGVRSLKASRHALIIGVGQYTAPGIAQLKGVPNDMRSARDIAAAMAIPDSNITYLRDTDATADAIRQALRDLESRVSPGDRVFVYYSGHGTRWVDPQTDPNSCTEGLLGTNGQALTNREISNLLAPIAGKADKLMVFYDACHSGGVANQPLRTRALGGDGASLTPKFVPQVSPELCAKPTNMRTRSLSAELGRQGAVPQNVVFVAASRPDEVSFDDPQRGGLATAAWRSCLLGKAADSDGSGSLTVDEITACAQSDIDRSLSRFPEILGQKMTIGGNRQFVPGTCTCAGTCAGTCPRGRCACATTGACSGSRTGGCRGPDPSTSARTCAGCCASACGGTGAGLDGARAAAAGGHAAHACPSAAADPRTARCHARAAGQRQPRHAAHRQGSLAFLGHLAA